MEITQVPAVEGWFTTGDEPALLASRGAETGSYFFPKNLAFSRNPAAPAEELTEVELSRRGRVWSWTTNHYQPPAPYQSPDPFGWNLVAIANRGDRLQRVPQRTAQVREVSSVEHPDDHATDEHDAHGDDDHHVGGVPH